MILRVPVMVSVNERGVHDVTLPGWSLRSFHGTSLSELLDDVALHLMETLPQASPRGLERLRVCPDLELRRVSVTVELPGPDKKKPTWTGRLAVVVTRWRDEDFDEVFVPRLSTAAFAVASGAELTAGLTGFVEELAKGVPRAVLDAAVCRKDDYLDVLEVDAELPTVLPSRPAKKRREKKKVSRPDEPKKPRKRELVMPRTLREVGADLTHQALDGRLPQAHGRDAIVEQVLRQIRRPGAAVLLVGPPGVGKTAIVHEVVRRMAAEGLPLHERTDVWSVESNRFIAGMMYVGAWEQRCHQMVEELEQRNDVVYVPDLPSLVYTGRSAHSDANVALFLEPHLRRGALRILGECTAERLEATRAEAPGFFARFQVVPVPALDERHTLQVLVQTTRALEAREPVVVEPEVLEGVLALTRRFLPRQPHPGKAVTLLRGLVDDHQKVEHDAFGRRRVARDHLVDHFGRQTGLPAFVLWEKQARPWEEVAAHFARRIIGQPLASQAAAEVVCTLQQGLNDPEKPLATMLFVGPTGVGKTETAKALAEYLFGHADRLVRFDMSELRDPWSAARLFGDRLQPEGELTRRVQQHPFSVVLFDEIEKGHPRVFDALLQVLGEGRLTNAAGRTTDFCNTILVMTSNLGVRDAQHGLGFMGTSEAAEGQHYRKAAEAFFRPEFFNRIDRIVAFRSLGREDLAPLVARTLEGLLGRRGLRRSGVLVEVEPALPDLLVAQGFDARYGARSLRRALEQRLTVPLARQLVSQPVDRTTRVELYRSGDDVGMRLEALEDAPAEPGLPPPAADWATFLAGYHAARAVATALASHPTLAALREEHAALLERFNAGALAPDGLDRLGVTGEAIDGVAGLFEDLDDLYETWLLPYEVVEQTELVPFDGRYIRNEDARRQRPQLVVQSMIATADREAQLPQAAAALASLEHRVAWVRRLLLVLVEPVEAVVLRLLPVTEGAGSRALARRLMSAMASTWHPWGHVTLWVRIAGEWQVGPDEPADALVAGDPELQDRSRFGKPPEVAAWEACAVEVRGHGVRRLVEAEVGYHLQSRHAGPDLVLDLVRAETVGDAPARLTGLDRELADFREARRAGAPCADPLPALLVRRRYAGSESLADVAAEALLARLVGG